MIQPWFERTYDQKHSIEVSRNAAEKYSWTVKAYYGDGESAETVALVAQVDADLRERFIAAKEAPEEP